MISEVQSSFLSDRGLAISKKKTKSADWFEDSASTLTPLVEAKRDALTIYKAFPSEINLLTLKSARSKVQQAARQCANEYWLHLCSKIELAADRGNIKGMYDGIKQALSPTE